MLAYLFCVYVPYFFLSEFFFKFCQFLIKFLLGKILIINVLDCYIYIIYSRWKSFFQIYVCQTVTLVLLTTSYFLDNLSIFPMVFTYF